MIAAAANSRAALAVRRFSNTSVAMTRQAVGPSQAADPIGSLEHLHVA
jgi:hypothetical protein